MNSLFFFLTLMITLFCTDLIAQLDDMQYSIGDTWTFERTNDRLKKKFFEEIKILDTLTRADRSCYVMDRGLLYDSDTMCIEDEKVYFWNPRLEDYQLQYDYGTDTSFIVKYKLSADIDSFEVYLDSIRIEQTDNRVDIPVHYFRSDWGYGGSEYTRRTYRGIGQDRHHPSYANGGFIIDEFEESNRVLRCFENDSTFLKFVNYPCDTTWIFPDTMDLANTIFSIGDTWTYERVLIPNPLRYNPLYFSIEDTVVWQGKVAFDISGTYMYERDKQIYFWDEGLGRYIKYYDFSGNLSTYNIEYLEKGQIGSFDIYFPVECQVKIDSISNRVDSLGAKYDIQYVSFDCSYNDLDGTFVQKIYNDEIIINVGHNLENPKINLANTSVDPPYFPNGIRCFENNSVQYQFKSYPCDTIFSEIRINTEDISNDVISISPNPNNGFFSIN